MANPYLSIDIVPSIAAEWQSKGYGTFQKLEDNTYLLYHIRAPNSHQYHIHICDSKNVISNPLLLNSTSLFWNNFYKLVGNTKYNHVTFYLSRLNKNNIWKLFSKPMKV